MTLVKSKTNGNGNGNLFPKTVTDFFNTDFFKSPQLFDFNRSLSRFEMPEMPSVNIVENGKDFKIEMAAPGLDKKDFKIEVENGILTISSEKKKEEKEEKENYRRQEFSYESFSRSFELPENSWPEKIDARYENGILKLTLPKKEQSTETQKKEIKVS